MSYAGLYAGMQSVGAGFRDAGDFVQRQQQLDDNTRRTDLFEEQQATKLREDATTRMVQSINAEITNDLATNGEDGKSYERVMGNLVADPGKRRQVAGAIIEGSPETRRMLDNKGVKFSDLVEDPETGQMRVQVTNRQGEVSFLTDANGAEYSINKDDFRRHLDYTVGGYGLVNTQRVAEAMEPGPERDAVLQQQAQIEAKLVERGLDPNAARTIAGAQLDADAIEGTPNTPTPTAEAPQNENVPGLGTGLPTQNQPVRDDGLVLREETVMPGEIPGAADAPRGDTPRRSVKDGIAGTSSGGRRGSTLLPTGMEFSVGTAKGNAKALGKGAGEVISVGGKLAGYTGGEIKRLFKDLQRVGSGIASVAAPIKDGFVEGYTGEAPPVETTAEAGKSAPVVQAPGSSTPGAVSASRGERPAPPPVTAPVTEGVTPDLHRDYDRGLASVVANVSRPREGRDAARNLAMYVHMMQASGLQPNASVMANLQAGDDMRGSDLAQLKEEQANARAAFTQGEAWKRALFKEQNARAKGDIKAADIARKERVKTNEGLLEGWAARVTDKDGMARNGVHSAKAAKYLAETALFSNAGVLAQYGLPWRVEDMKPQHMINLLNAVEKSLRMNRNRPGAWPFKGDEMDTTGQIHPSILPPETLGEMKLDQLREQNPEGYAEYLGQFQGNYGEAVRAAGTSFLKSLEDSGTPMNIDGRTR